MTMFALTGPSEVARQVDSALLIFLVICLVLLAGITATMIYFVVKYRRSKTRRTKQIRTNLKLEVTWTVLPTLLVIGMFFIGYEGFITMRNPPPDAMTVTVTAQQWFWTFGYPKANVTDDELYVPVDRAVKLTITAPVDDVVHSFYVPAFRIKEDAVPGAETFLWIEAEKTGTYNVFCAEFCGKDHARMISKLHVLSQADFDAWLKRKIAERYRPIDAAAAMDPDYEGLEGYDGAELFGKYCAACHMKSGKGGGPYDARDLTSLQGWKRGTKLTDIFWTISAGIEGTQMRAFGHLPVRERFAMMHHVASFAEGQERPEVTKADLQALEERFPETDPSKAQPEVSVEPEVPLDEAMRKVVDDARR